MKCSDCGSTNIIQCISDLTCTQCGLEQRIGNMIHEINYYDRVGECDSDLRTCIGGSIYTPLQRVLQYVNKTRKTNKNNIHFSNVHETLAICDDNMIKLCTDMFNDYTSIKCIKTDHNVLNVYLAIVSICCDKSPEIIKQMYQVNVSKKIHEIKHTLRGEYKWNRFDFDKHVEIIHNQLATITEEIDKKHIVAFRKNVFKMYDFLKDNKYLVQGIHEKGVNGAIVYIVKDKMKINLKLKTICKCFDVSSTNILCIVKKIVPALSKNMLM
jgi:hypothetical protein